MFSLRGVVIVSHEGVFYSLRYLVLHYVVKFGTVEELLGIYAVIFDELCR
jgi:hypothetical protein